MTSCFSPVKCIRIRRSKVQVVIGLFFVWMVSMIQLLWLQIVVDTRVLWKRFCVRFILAGKHPPLSISRTPGEYRNSISLFEIWRAQCYNTIKVWVNLCVYTQTKQYTPLTTAIPQKGLWKYALYIDFHTHGIGWKCTLIVHYVL